MTAGRTGNAQAATGTQPPELHAPNGARLFDSARGVLLGSHCARCGGRSFPARTLCPECFAEGGMEEYELAREGVVYASTVVRVASSLGHVPPYAYGYVDLADGLRVIGRFSGDSPEAFVPGAEVELSFETLTAASAPAVLVWVFRMRRRR